MPIITVSGRSGSGKDALVHRLLAMFPKASRLPSITTRAPRVGERNSGYEHVSEPEFEGLVQSGAFVWDEGKFGNRYGTRRADAKAALLEGLHFAALFPWNVTDLHALALESGKKHLMRSIYIETRDEELLRSRMLGRGDPPHKVEERLLKDRHWDPMARLGVNRYLFLSAHAPLDEKVAKAAWWITGDIQASFLRRCMPYTLPLP